MVVLHLTESNDEEILKSVASGKYEFKQNKWKNVSSSVKDLIQKMLVLDVEDRISASEALDHEWFKKFKEGAITNKKLKGAFSGLKKFKASQKMQQAALGYIVTHMATKDDTKELDEAFKKMDINHDGKISLDELLQSIKTIYPEMTEDEATKLFKEADVDKSGHIDYTEWIQATINKKKILTENNLRAAFKTFDEDGDGNISLDEIKHLLGKGKKIKDKVWNKILDEVDINKDGFVDFDEFKIMMQNFL